MRRGWHRGGRERGPGRALGLRGALSSRWNPPPVAGCRVCRIWGEFQHLGVLGRD